MKKILTLFFILLSVNSFSQTIGKTQTEQYKASFETAIDISQFLDYERTPNPNSNFKMWNI